MFNRSKIQFNRLKGNITIKEIFKRNNIYISYKAYEADLKKNEYISEYDTLSFYLIEKFKDKKYKKLREKYIKNKINKYNARFLLSMLAVREVDDDWRSAPCSWKFISKFIWAIQA